MKRKNVLLQALVVCIAAGPAAFAQNVGIGTITPTYKLDIKGHINISKDSVFRINKEPVLSTAGTYNVFVGPYAGFNTPADLFPPSPNDPNGFNGDMNTMVGYQAGYENTSGKTNTYVGYKSGWTGTSASNNAFFGYGAGFSNTGANNTFIGSISGYDNTTGSHNVFLGYWAGANNEGGSNNVFAGYFAGADNQGGTHNVFIGREAGLGNTEGHHNTFVGTLAGSNNETGDYNTYLGYNARPSALLPNLTNATVIGYNAQAFGSNQVRLGNSNVTSIGGYASWSDLSDGRFKVNVQEAVQGLAFIKQLRPVTYNLDLTKLDRHLQVADDSISHTPAFRSARAAKEQELHSGFIAQEVEQAAKALGFTFSGVDLPQNDKDTYKLRYAEFTVPLVKAVQELAAENDLLKKELAELKKLVQKLINSD